MVQLTTVVFICVTLSDAGESLVTLGYPRDRASGSIQQTLAETRRQHVCCQLEIPVEVIYLLL